MEGSLTESVQQYVRKGKCVDLYYPDPETAKKQCFRTTQNTRYTQAFSNRGGGSSVFTIPPNNGVQDIVVSMTLPQIGTGLNLAVGRGWAYALIKQISFRYGGSSQYFLSGQQVLQSALSMASETGSQSALLSLGGDALAGDQLAVANNQGYVWLPLPHCIPTAEGKLPPLPSDLLTQQIQVTVELYPLSKIYSIGTGGLVASVPSELSSASFTVQQVIFENQGDALARRVDMSSHALSYPITFRQQEVTIPLANGQTIVGAAGSSQSVTLTGFRSGEVKAIHCWLTADSANTPVPAVGAVQNPFAWYPLRDVTMTYAGEVYARFDGNSGQLWNLVNGRVPAQVSDIMVVAGATPTITTARADSWTILPFGQSYDDVTAHSTYMAGKPITNGIVNLSFTIPPGAPDSTYTLHVSYVYNAVLTFSQGTCDYVF